jgi:hypothetical protein
MYNSQNLLAIRAQGAEGKLQQNLSRPNVPENKFTSGTCSQKHDL